MPITSSTQTTPTYNSVSENAVNHSIASQGVSELSITPVDTAEYPKNANEVLSALNTIITPEQKNTLQNTVDDKITMQTENIKDNYQTAKDTDLMRAYYEQQQKLFDIYIQSSAENNTSISSTSDDSNKNSAVSSLTNAYVDLYQLHQNVKDGVSQLPAIEMPVEIQVQTIGTNEVSQAISAYDNPLATKTVTTPAEKQIDAYNSLMMPSSSSYMHMSA